MNQGISLGRIGQAFLRRRWIFLTAVAVGLLGSLLWLFRQKAVTVYTATSRLVSSEKVEESAEDIIPGYLYPSSARGQESRMGRVAADIMSLDFLAEVARRTGILYVVTERNNPNLIIEELVLSDTAARGKYRISVESRNAFVVEGPNGTKKGTLGENFSDGLISLRLARADLQDGDFVEFQLVSPQEMAYYIQSSISIDISRLSESAAGIRLPTSAGFSEPLVMSITLTWNDPGSATILVNGIAQCAIEENLKRKRAQFEQSKEFINEQMERYSAELARIADEMRSFREREGIVDISAEEAKVAERLAQKDAELAAIEMEERQLRNIMSWIKGSDSIPGYAEFLIADPTISNLFGTARATSLELANASQVLGENHPDVKALRVRLANLKSELSTAISARQKALSIQKTALMGELEKEKASLSEIMEKELQYLQLERQKEAAEDIYTLLAQRYEEIRINEASVTSDVTILEEAPRASAITTKPRVVRIPLLGLLIGLLAGTALVLVMEYLDTTVREDTEGPWGEERGRLRYIATVPRVEMAGPEPVALRDPMFMEVFRIAALNIGLFGPLKKNKTLCVTSPSEGEGKTTVALNLAASLAASGERVLLVDADANKRSLTMAMGLEDKKGFFEILVNGSPPENVIVEGPLPNLFIMPIGRQAFDPMAALSTEVFRSFLERVKRSFDLVIFDTPPALLLALAGLLAPQVDSTVLVAKIHATSTRNLVKAIEILINAGASVAGIILNMAKVRRASYYYGKRRPWWKRLLRRE
ncbi:MAG: polysaccharide biosynthesis tyrosine autokinase [candidate division WOR-3 bacterium]